MTVKDELKRLLKEYGKLRKPWVFRVRRKEQKPGRLAEHIWHPWLFRLLDPMPHRPWFRRRDRVG